MVGHRFEFVRIVRAESPHPIALGRSQPAQSSPMAARDLEPPGQEALHQPPAGVGVWLDRIDLAMVHVSIAAVQQPCLAHAHADGTMAARVAWKMGSGRTRLVRSERERWMGSRTTVRRRRPPAASVAHAPSAPAGRRAIRPGFADEGWRRSRARWRGRPRPESPAARRHDPDANASRRCGERLPGSWPKRVSCRTAVSVTSRVEPTRSANCRTAGDGPVQSLSPQPVSTSASPSPVSTSRQ